ncbi:MAG: hypothetical protein HOA15_01265 [Candidatus Marinimicrobia bacterium]|nr:hypothetical protein [Candidatus Neomarinimicrobiota bacterium]MBT3675210.1 hypothetical protein [Candidatus Neomarinimicrobiota bacterium]MBT3762626.1 hypothetical protein [Candidatus Neomarinimicrobiota bacterium]MBT4068320.1 hypothetical protein [Candidatus Neomarinimicrobiota bacterium]MBT4270171.1 hypothetical protein [Candidatus Neomarinimicrobiota bacterium]
MVKHIVLLMFGTILFSQEIDWKEKPSPITAIHIFCDTENIPIYVDGLHVGASPVKDPVQVAPGWHQVSYFPPQTMVNTQAISQNKKMRDMIKLARQDVLVEEGKTIRVVLSYRSIEAEALEYDRRLSSSSWVGLGMVFATFGLIVWGLM